MTAKMWIECLIMLMTTCVIFFGALLAATDSLSRRLQWKGKCVAFFVDCCYVGLNLSLGGTVFLVPAWVFVAVYEFFTR